MGWNSADPTQPLDPAWHGLDLPPFFYFVHSYFPVPADPAIIAAHTTYGTTFASMVRHQQTFATQFHPEKSQHAGLQLLRNFLTTTR